MNLNQTCVQQFAYGQVGIEYNVNAFLGYTVGAGVQLYGNVAGDADKLFVASATVINQDEFDIAGTTSSTSCRTTSCSPSASAAA